MWLSRAALALVAAALLGACGFRPLYGTRDDVSRELAAIDVRPIPDRAGQLLSNQLEELLTPRGRPARPRYTLEVQLSENTERLAVEKTAFATRANLHVSVNYTLLDAATGKPVHRGSGEAVSSYNIVSSEFATLIAEKDARTRALRQLGDEIRSRLAAYLAGAKGAAGTTAK